MPACFNNFLNKKTPKKKAKLCFYVPAQNPPVFAKKKQIINNFALDPKIILYHKFAGIRSNAL